MSRPRIQYVPREDATLEGELNALAAVYRIILDTCKEKAAARAMPDGYDDMEGRSSYGQKSQP